MVEKQRFDEAITHFRKALEVDPTYPEAHNGLGRALAEKGSLNKAIAHFQKALEVNPYYAEAHNNLGVAVLRKGKADKAIAHFEKALQANPYYAEAHYNLGNTFYYFRGEIPQALAHWRRVLRVKPNHLAALNQTAWVLATSPEAAVRNGAEAVELAERAGGLSGGREPVILNTQAAAYAEVGRFPEAAETSRRALALATQLNEQPLAEALKVRIALYEAETPLREAPQASASLPSRP